MPAPKVKLLYFKHILDGAVRSFFEECGNCFTRSDGKYVFSGGLSHDRLVRHFSDETARKIRELARPFDVLSPEYFFLLGDCEPADNVLFASARRGLPEKLSEAICSGRCRKYALSEKDIEIDMAEFNSAMDDAFDAVFSGREKFAKTVGDGFFNVFAIRHAELDCYSMFKVLKYVFGPKNCVNAASGLERSRAALVSANEVIDRYVNNKAALNGSPRFKRIVAEVRQYAEECVATANGMAMRGV